MAVTSASVVSAQLTNFDFADDFPVQVVSGKVNVNPQTMIIGKSYFVTQNGSDYLVEKSQDGIVRVYKVES